MHTHAHTERQRRERDRQKETQREMLWNNPSVTMNVYYSHWLITDWSTAKQEETRWESQTKGMLGRKMVESEELLTDSKRSKMGMPY